MSAYTSSLQSYPGDQTVTRPSLLKEVITEAAATLDQNMTVVAHTFRDSGEIGALGIQMDLSFYSNATHSTDPTLGFLESWEASVGAYTLAGPDNNDRRALLRDSIAHVLRSMWNQSSHGGMLCRNKDSEDWEVRSDYRSTSWFDLNGDIHLGRTYMLSVTPIVRPRRY